MCKAFRAPCACIRCSLLQHRAGGLRALQMLPQFCAPREYHGRPHEAVQSGQSRARGHRSAVGASICLQSLLSAAIAGTERKACARYKRCSNSVPLANSTVGSMRPRSPHGPCGLHGQRLINSVVLAYLLLACIEPEAMVRVIPGRAERGATGAL
jgi:hypothetical protein